MPPRPSPPLPPDPPPLRTDRRLWWGLAVVGATLALMVLAVHRLVQPPPPAPNPGSANLNGNAPLLTRPQLLENQQAMPELLDFDAQTPPPNPSNNSPPPGTSAPPSALGTGALGR
jgi:hypothetical protein